MNKKICIIVDNPSRDLKGILLLSLYLLEKFDVFLVEQYNKRELYLLRPAIVIFHNARKNNISEIIFCKKNNIKVCILDTEGGYDSFGVMNEVINHELKKNLKLVDLYFCWGLYMYKKLKKNINKNFKKKIKLTGSPKSDLIHHYSQKKFPDKIDILFNTSFPIIDPRYGNKKKTIKFFKKELNYINNKKKISYLKASESNQDEFIDLIKKISADYTNKRISIRIHPFESKKKYEILSKNFKNIKIVSDNEDLNETLKYAKVLIHYNCTTSFEFYLLKKYKTIMPNYFKSSNYLKFNEYIKKSSKLNTSYDQIKKNIDLILNMKKREKINLNSYKIKNLNEVFFNSNGNACLEISKYIFNLKLNPKKRIKNINEFENKFFLNNSFKEKLINIFYYYDPKIYRILRNMIYPWKLRTKELNLKLIQDEINKLMKFMNIKKKVFVKRAIAQKYERRKDYKTLAFEIKK